MKIAPLSVLNKLKSHVAARPNPTAEEIRAVKKFVNCGLGEFETKLMDTVRKNEPELITRMGGIEYVPPDTVKRRAATSFKSFISMPLEAIDAIAKKFPDSKLNNAKFLKKHRLSSQVEKEIKALQGIHESGVEYVRKKIPSGPPYPSGPCTHDCEVKCNKVVKEFNKKLNKTMGNDVAKYDTKKERFATRLISGITAALFLGNDFYNKSIQKGESVENAKKEQHLKQGQEILENVCEAITQFAVFSCFSRTINAKPWSTAVIATLIGLASRIVSRLSSGMQITRVKVPEQTQKPVSTISMESFAKSAKEGKTEELLVKNTEERVAADISSHKEKKKPILSGKNIALFCLTSVALGYAFRFLKGNTSAGKKIAQMMKNHSDKVNKDIIEDIMADKESLAKMKRILETNGETNLANHILENILEKHKGEDLINIGTDYKTTKLFGKVEVKTKDLKALKSTPVWFVKELVSYPYKIVSKLEEAVRNSKLLRNNKELPEKPGILKDTYQIRNLYKRFMEFQEKYSGNDAKLNEEFSKYVREMRLLSNNNVTSSKGNNSKIAVMAQTLGTLTGMWFNMNDEFNSSIRNGANKEEAEKDARLRGINKFFRMTVQIIISGSLNSIFEKQYNNSIGKSALVVAATTVLTDMASRLLSGMPSKKMTKEELEKYQKDYKEGAMAWYYKMIDKLAS